MLSEKPVRRIFSPCGVLGQWCVVVLLLFTKLLLNALSYRLTTWSFNVFVLVFRSNHNVISRIGSRQKMQRYREGVLREWRRLLLHTWDKSAVLQVSFTRFFSLWCLFVYNSAGAFCTFSLSKLFTLIQNSFSIWIASTCRRCDFNVLGCFFSNRNF